MASGHKTKAVFQPYPFQRQISPNLNVFEGLTPLNNLSCSSDFLICQFTNILSSLPEFCQMKCDTIAQQLFSQNKNFTEIRNKPRHFYCSCHPLNKKIISPAKFTEAQKLTLHKQYSKFQQPDGLHSENLQGPPHQNLSNLGQVLSLQILMIL